jgi:hypothetical protein
LKRKERALMANNRLFERSMGVKERKMCQHVRRKALTVPFDLARIYAAGTLPGGRGENPFLKAKSAEGLVGRACDLITCLAVTETREEAAKLFQQILKLVS